MNNIIQDNLLACELVLVPVIARNDKTMVSVATGYQEYHSVYVGARNVDNTTWCSHFLGMEPIALLPIPKSKFLCLLQILN